MPPLSVMLGTQSLKGFEAVNNPPTPQMSKPEERQDMLNPYLRCPLPPFSTTVDTIRQWNMTGKLPVMRVIPLPTSQGASGGVATNVTNVTESTSGSSSSGNTPTTLTALTLVVPVPTLLPGGTYSTFLRAAESYQLIMISATQPVEVRLYSNATTQSVDQFRLTDVSVNFNQIQGVVTDIVMDTAPYSWGWENRVGVNADSPQTTKLYVTVVNPSQVAAVPASAVTIVLLPLES